MFAVRESFRRQIGAALEAGRPPDVWPLRWAERGWARLAEQSLHRTIAVPPSCRVVGIVSAVLGGAGKTPICIALARAYAARDGATSVAVVGHAYRGKPPHARVVRPSDAVTEVGDDALYAARALCPDGISVVVAPSRSDALRHAAARGAETLIVDGLFRSRSGRAHQTVLVLDGERPWGAGRCPPLGDLRAHPRALLAAADVVAWTRDDEEDAPPPDVSPRGENRRLAYVTASMSHAVSQRGARLALTELPAPIGLITAIAHPERVLGALERRGIRIADWVRLADHATAAEAKRKLASRSPVSVWLTPARCAVCLPSEVHGAPILALDHQVDATELLAAIT